MNINKQLQQLRQLKQIKRNQELEHDSKYIGQAWRIMGANDYECMHVLKILKRNWNAALAKQLNNPRN